MSDKKENEEKKSEKRKGTWGWTSYNVDDEKEDDPQLIYTRVEKSGRVNQYPDNGDGRHGHFSWDKKEDFDHGEKPNQSRVESGSSENPSSEDVNSSSGCYLTTACMHHYKQDFNDKCYELELLRLFRDSFVTDEDIEHYYEVAPIIVKGIEKEKFSETIFDHIYHSVIDKCVKAIENGDNDFAYNRYKNSVAALEKKYLKIKEQIDNNEELGK